MKEVIVNLLQICSCYKLDVDKSTNLEIHFRQLNLLKLFLFKNQKDLCQKKFRKKIRKARKKEEEFAESSDCRSESEFEWRDYRDCIDFYQKETELTKAVQTSIRELNGIRVAIGVMDFQFLEGSKGSAVTVRTHN